MCRDLDEYLQSLNACCLSLSTLQDLKEDIDKLSGQIHTLDLIKLEVDSTKERMHALESLRVEVAELKLLPNLIDEVSKKVRADPCPDPHPYSHPNWERSQRGMTQSLRHLQGMIAKHRTNTCRSFLF